MSSEIRSPLPSTNAASPTPSSRGGIPGKEPTGTAQVEELFPIRITVATQGSRGLEPSERKAWVKRTAPPSADHFGARDDPNHEPALPETMAGKDDVRPSFTSISTCCAKAHTETSSSRYLPALNGITSPLRSRKAPTQESRISIGNTLAMANAPSGEIAKGNVLDVSIGFPVPESVARTWRLPLTAQTWYL